MLERIKERLWGGGISMKLPLFLLFLMTGFFPMYILGKVTDQSFRQTQIDSRVMEVQNQCLIISNRMSRSGYMSEESRDSTVDVELDTIAAIFNGRIVVVNRNFKVIKDTFRLAEGRTHVAEEVIRCFQGESGSRLEAGKACEVNGSRVVPAAAGDCLVLCIKRVDMPRPAEGRGG